MRRVTALAGLALLAIHARTAATLAAQTRSTSPAESTQADPQLGRTTRDEERRPVLLLQPGMLSADFWSPPDGFPATSGFNLRFATLVPSSSRWWTLIVGASVTPYGTSGVSVRSTNTPVLFIGNVFPGIAARRTGGWFDLAFPVYLTYSYDGGGARNRQIYGRDLVGEAALQFFVGEKVLGDLGPMFRRLRVYLMVNQLLTPNKDLTSERTERFNPVALYGVTLPIGGRGAVR